MTKNFRIEKDSMGTIEVPMEALWGAQTHRSIINFSMGEVRYLGLLKTLSKLNQCFQRNNDQKL